MKKELDDKKIVILPIIGVIICLFGIIYVLIVQWYTGLLTILPVMFLNGMQIYLYMKDRNK